MPFVRVSSTGGQLADDRSAAGIWPRLPGSAKSQGVRALGAVWGEESARRRLEQAGRDPEVERFRVDQLRWACLGVAIMLVLGVLRAAGGRPLAPGLWLIACVVAAVGGALLCDQMLSRAARSRCARISAELPAFAELLAFTVAAGLAPVSALNRVAFRLGGELSAELRRATDEIAQGSTFADSLEAVATRTGAPSVRRFVDGIVIAIQRGTPVAEVLRAQAMDARDAGYRALMETAGKREIYALVPVVFLILPIVVVVAVFPGVYGLVLRAA